MTSAEIRDGIENELRRVLIRNHASYPVWYASIKPYACQIIDFILEEDLTPDSILLAQNAPMEEYDEYQFISIIAGGNPIPSNMPALTNFALGDLLYEVREFGKKAK
jgi:hypothetical protein